MALPSQRSNGSRGAMVNVRRTKGVPLVALIGAGLIGLGLLGTWMWFGPDRTAGAPELGSGSGLGSELGSGSGLVVSEASRPIASGAKPGAGAGAPSPTPPAPAAYVPVEITTGAGLTGSGDGVGGILGSALAELGAEAERPTSSGGTTRGDPDTAPMTRATEPAAKPADAGARGPASAARSPSDTRVSTPKEPSGSLPAPVASAGDVAAALAEAEKQVAAGAPVAARERLQAALRGAAEGRDAAALRAAIDRLNRELVLGKTIAEGDPWVEAYTIGGGDTLTRIATRRELAIDWRLLQRVNGLKNANQIRTGDRLKLVRGPFHAVVVKGEYRLDVYRGVPGEPEAWDYVMSLPVGLGEGDSTPTGRFVVKRQSKLVNPYWINPRTGQHFAAADPANPIGERWIGLEGLGPDAVKTGYGIHGTIEADSIGSQRSMGCVRMREADVELVYELLVEGVSMVEIRE